jgi:glucan phosphoethanolaminetransferase (alkaline phosphatase superfamily)
MQKISTIVLYILAAVSVVIAVLFFVGGNVVDATGVVTAEPKNTGLALGWTFILFAITVALTLLFSLYYLITHPKALKGAIISLVAVAVLVLISYLLASDAPAPGRDIEDTAASTLKWVGTGLYAAWILGGVAIFGIIVSEIYRALS